MNSNKLTTNYLTRIFKNASPAFIKANSDQADSDGQITKSECVTSNEPLETPQLKDGDTTKYKISYLSIRRRLIDPENLLTKYHTDSLRYEGLIKDDTYKLVKIEADQQKCKTKEEEKTIITITYL